MGERAGRAGADDGGRLADEAVVEVAIAEIRLSSTAVDWRDRMAERAEALRDTLRPGPSRDDTHRLLAGYRPVAARLYRVDDRLPAGRFSVQPADRAWNTTDSYVYGYLRKE